MLNVMSCSGIDRFTEGVCCKNSMLLGGMYVKRKREAAVMFLVRPSPDGG